MSITAEEAIELIEAKKQKDEQRFIKKFDEDPEMEILNGRFGPYISYKKKNYRIPKTIEKPENLTLEECQKIIAEKYVREAVESIMNQTLRELEIIIINDGSTVKEHLPTR